MIVTTATPEVPATSEAVRARLVETLRRDLVGPGPDDADIARERLGETPSRWCLTGFITPAEERAAGFVPARALVDDELEAI